MVQKSRQLELPLEDRDAVSKAKRSGQTSTATSENGHLGTSPLMAQALTRANLIRAFRRVKSNRGAPGVDGVSIEEFRENLWDIWPGVLEKLSNGTYQPQPSRQVEIPKPGGGKRLLGIPTVLDRLIQQALLQVLQPIFEPSFSRHSHGFRLGRSAHGAIREARGYIQEGKRWVVDVDIEKFFDRVNHDVLMGKLAKNVDDLLVLGLIRRFLSANVMVDGVVTERDKGTPQGSPLSPLLANILLNDVDRTLEKRGHFFVRYADDLRVFVSSKKAGERVMHSLVTLFGKLRLQVNIVKSAVDRVWKRAFLGVSFWMAKGKQVRMRISKKTRNEVMHRVRCMTRRNRGRSLDDVVTRLRSYLLGWRGYFRICETPGVFQKLDGWIRRRLRAYLLKQWKRGTTAYPKLISLGLRPDFAKQVAGNTQRWWRNSAKSIHGALPNKFFEELGLPRLVA